MQLYALMWCFAMVAQDGQQMPRMGNSMPLDMPIVWASVHLKCSFSSLLVATCTHCCLCVMLPVLVLCTLWPVYTLNVFRAMVEHAQALRQVTDFSVYSLVPTCNGLMM